MRSRVKDGALHSGNLGIAVDDKDAAVLHFVKKAWKVIKALNSCTLSSFDNRSGELLQRNISNFIVGPDAKALSISGMRLHYAGALTYFYKAE
jgi:hypothetical protein